MVIRKIQRKYNSTVLLFSRCVSRLSLAFPKQSVNVKLWLSENTEAGGKRKRNHDLMITVCDDSSGSKVVVVVVVFLLPFLGSQAVCNVCVTDGYYTVVRTATL